MCEHVCAHITCMHMHGEVRGSPAPELRLQVHTTAFWLFLKCRFGESKPRLWRWRAQWLRALAVPAKDPCFPEPRLQLICHPSSRGSDDLPWIPWAPSMDVVYIHICREKTHTLKKRDSCFKKTHINKFRSLCLPGKYFID